MQPIVEEIMRLVICTLAMLLNDGSFLCVILHVPAPRFRSAERSPLSLRPGLGACALLFDPSPVTPALNHPAPGLKKGTPNHENFAISSNGHFSRYLVEQFVLPRLGFGGRVFRD
jgi:hypothetical protein